MSPSSRSPASAAVEFEYLIGTPDGITHEHETHVTGLFTREEHLDALKAAGLDASFDEEGLIGRGISIGVGGEIKTPQR